jgi:stress-induced morphogen
MYTYEKFVQGKFKCRICSSSFGNPDELRNHRMVEHKGHMLAGKR